MGRFVVLAAFFSFWLALLPPAWAQGGGETATTDPKVLAIYGEGKKRYDAGDYAGARGKFIEAVRLEPENPRWHYNLGLALRQLDNYQGAREAFLRSRSLAPDYKRAEIDDKLASMGFDPAGMEIQGASRLGQQSGAVPVEAADGGIPWEMVATLGAMAGILGVIAFVLRRKGKTAGKEQKPAHAPVQLPAERKRLEAIGRQLVAVEHAMALGENPDLRSQLEYASRAEQSAFRLIAQAEGGDRIARGKLRGSLEEAVRAAGEATETARRLHGDDFQTARGERAGCFFCARPLANGEAGRPLVLAGGGRRDSVLACPDCAARARQGDLPPVRTAADGRTHWSEIPDYDPYAGRHAPAANLTETAPWRFQPRQPVADIARLAGGALLAGAAGAAAAATLDLDAARQAGLAQEALAASARRTAEQRDSRSADHS